jgi:hypothetical protein
MMQKSKIYFQQENFNASGVWNKRKIPDVGLCILPQYDEISIAA